MHARVYHIYRKNLKWKHNFRDNIRIKINQKDIFSSIFFF
jgi:hypothetical protein